MIYKFGRGLSLEWSTIAQDLPLLQLSQYCGLELHQSLSQISLSSLDRKCDACACAEFSPQPLARKMWRERAYFLVE
jgi:hypothetical protein